MNKEVRVLMVDDDPVDRVLVEEYLSQAGQCRFVVEHAEDYDSGVAALKRQQHDVYLVDYYLGARTGLDWLNEAREMRCEQPVIILTGQGAETLDDEVMTRGASDYLPKEELSTSLLQRVIRHAIEHKNSELALQRLAKHDSLTGLGNRLLFEEILSYSLARSQRFDRQLAVLFLDLDRFKEVNDTLGHPVGDQLLRQVAERIRNGVRECDVVARMGGDEFTMLLDDIPDFEAARVVAEKLVASLGEPMQVSGNILNLSASVGIALYPDNGDTAVALMQKADMALYAAKARGAGNIQFFTDSLQTRLERSIQVEQGLREALENGEFELHLQPKWSIDGVLITGFEGLIRWRRQDGSLVMPNDFIAVAEKTGLIVPIGNWVIQESCRLLQEWQARGLELSLSINVSPVQMRDPSFCSRFEALVAPFGGIPSGLEIELTEEMLIDITGDQHRLPCELKRLKSQGLGISIDDFGTGYSSLRYLKQFPLDTLKIDKSFVSGENFAAGGNVAVAEPEIARAIVTLAESLGLTVVAEGVETREQMMMLRQLGCQQGQGYLVGRPMHQDQALDFAMEHNLGRESQEVF
ncbi:MAG: EAL domain-containing protein [Oleiphilaceae bacterium]|nr:EAL domain-containing protein [Oleiphilaceae bacterium]